MSETPDNNAPRIGGILLAAGGSSRMGRPKQLLVYKGKTLLRRATETLLNSACDLVVVILGAEVERSKNDIEDLPVRTVLNENWQTGMSSSIRGGLEYLLEIQPDLSAVVITLCDQPNITSSHIDQLTEKFRETGNEIVAAAYGNTVGVPALFTKRFFNELLGLEGDKGARNLIKANANVLSTVPIPEALFDIDTV
jgi:molybdenum cofactor cytidylyltransferase